MVDEQIKQVATALNANHAPRPVQQPTKATKVHRLIMDVGITVIVLVPVITFLVAGK